MKSLLEIMRIIKPPVSLVILTFIWLANTQRNAAANLPTPSAPTIAAIDNQAMVSNSTFSISIAGSETPNALLVATTSDNPALLPETSISLSPRGTDRLLTIVPVAQAGAAKITVSVTDTNHLSSTTSFIVAVCNSSSPAENAAALNEALGHGIRYASLTRASTRFAPGTYHLTSGLRTAHDGQRIYADARSGNTTPLARLVFHFPLNQIAFGLCLQHSECSLENLGLTSSQNLPMTYLALVRATQTITRNTIRHCNFYGGAGNFLRDEGTETFILDNLFHSDIPENVSEALSINNDRRFQVTGNQFHNICGFSVKVRGGGILSGATSGAFASGNIESNLFSNALSVATQPYVNSQANYLFTNMANQAQVSLWVTSAHSNQCWGTWGGSLRNAARVNWTGQPQNNSIRVHLNYWDILPPDSSLSLLGWRSIEHVNIDGYSSNIWVRYNAFHVSGDSAITICNDSKSTSVPSNIRCENNRFSDIACAGIYFQDRGEGCTAKGNTFTRTGLGNIGSHYDPHLKEWNGQIPWSTCIFDAQAAHGSLDYGAPNYSNTLIDDPLNPICTRTSNTNDLSDPWCHANPF